MSRQNKRIIVVGVVVFILLGALSRMLPSYNYVSVSGPDGTVQVERAGFGPGEVNVETSGASIQSSTR